MITGAIIFFVGLAIGWASAYVRYALIVDRGVKWPTKPLFPQKAKIISMEEPIDLI